MRTGEKIKELLEIEGITQKELCERTKISPSAMCKYLSSSNPLRTDILIKISRALNVSLYVLLDIDQEVDPYTICKNALYARSGNNNLTEDQKIELVNLILKK